MQKTAAEKSAEECLDQIAKLVQQLVELSYDMASLTADATQMMFELGALMSKLNSDEIEDETRH